MVSRPVKWTTGFDCGPTDYYNQAWAASGIQGTSVETWTNRAAAMAAIAGYSAVGVAAIGGTGTGTFFRTGNSAERAGGCSNWREEVQMVLHSITGYSRSLRSGFLKVFVTLASTSGTSRLESISLDSRSKPMDGIRTTMGWCPRFGRNVG